MPKKRLKKTGRVCVSSATMHKLISLGAAHHSTVLALKKTARAVPAAHGRKKRKKARKKSSKKRSRR